MGKIRLLPKNLINLIAAGEVVERPASVLKELLENSIDAKATEIIINIEEAGNKLISVQDNGVGMNKEDASMAFKQHATSKLITEEDLQNITTLGFRGEALASISSVAESVTLESKSKESDAIKIEVKSSEESESVTNQTKQGTTISVLNLFKNIPARRKFLKSEATELKYITSMFINTALVNTDVHFELYHNGRLLYKLTKTKDIKERIFEIWGGEVAKNLIETNWIEGSLCNLKLLVGRPEISKKTNYLQFSYINDRYVVNKTISAAVFEAFKGFIHKDLKPVFFILIHISPSKVDVNIHPRKLEVKFENSEEIFRLVYSATKKLLEKQTKQIISNNLNEPTTSTFSTSNNTYYPKPEVKNEFSHGSSGHVVRDTRFQPSSRPGIQQALDFTKNLVEYSTMDNVSQYHGTTTEQETQGISQYLKTYIVVERNNSVIFIDQHAAAEKILFEKLVKDYGHAKTKPLLVPEIINLSKADKETVISKTEELKKIGIVVEDFGQDSIQVVEIPEEIKKFNTSDYIEKIIQDNENEIPAIESYSVNNNITLSKESYYLIATTACHGSIRAGQKLTQEEMITIVKNLDKLEKPYNCPHGRPTMWRLDKDEIEKHFKRKI